MVTENKKAYFDVFHIERAYLQKAQSANKVLNTECIFKLIIFIIELDRKYKVKLNLIWGKI